MILESRELGLGKHAPAASCNSISAVRAYEMAGAYDLGPTLSAIKIATF